LAECKYFKICGLQAAADTEEDLCILHSQLPTKSEKVFMEAFGRLRRQNAHNYSNIVFPPKVFSGGQFTNGGRVIFANATFTGDVNFRGRTFSGESDFSGASFMGNVDFSEARFGLLVANPADGVRFCGAIFAKKVNFSKVLFIEFADFDTTMFHEEADFHNAIFRKQADFNATTFASGADFREVRFSKGAAFIDTKFGGPTNFSGSAIFDRTFFASNDTAHPIFRNAQVEFTGVHIDPLDAVIIRDADLRKCQFLATDLRKVEITSVTWPRKGGRFRVYDEDVPLAEGESRPWSHVERVYRELKQNHEERRDFERAGDFHFGEKEMRRRNPRTPAGLKFFLFLYRWISGYGELYILPLIWTAILLVGSAFGYLYWGLLNRSDECRLAWSFWNRLKAAHYSFRMMFFLKPDDLVPIGYAKLLNTAESLLGPLLIGLFALALRQRLKR
jgi:uncharacterized protein YjbI with pentapeptide repeats